MKSRIAAGLAMMLASFPCFGAGGYIIQKTMEQRTSTANQVVQTDAQCRVRLNTIGKLAEVGPEGMKSTIFEITVPNVSDARKALADVTAAQALCPHRTVTGVCLGEACDRSAKGVTLKFRLSGKPV